MGSIFSWKTATVSQVQGRVGELPTEVAAVEEKNEVSYSESESKMNLTTFVQYEFVDRYLTLLNNLTVNLPICSLCPSCPRVSNGNP